MWHEGFSAFFLAQENAIGLVFGQANGNNFFRYFSSLAKFYVESAIKVCVFRLFWRYLVLLCARIYYLFFRRLRNANPPIASKLMVVGSGSMVNWPDPKSIWFRVNWEPW